MQKNGKIVYYPGCYTVLTCLDNKMHFETIDCEFIYCYKKFDNLNKVINLYQKSKLTANPISDVTFKSAFNYACAYRQVYFS